MDLVGRVVCEGGEISLSPLSLPALIVMLDVFFEEFIELMCVFCEELRDFRF